MSSVAYDPIDTTPPQTLRFSRFVLDGRLRELYRDGARVELRRRPMSILWHLIRNRDRVVSGEELHRFIWRGVRVSDAALASGLYELRRALGPDGSHLIQTLRGHGYRFTGEVQTASTTASGGCDRSPCTDGLLESIVERLQRDLEAACVSARIVVVAVIPSPPTQRGASASATRHIGLVRDVGAEGA